jgi:hypothetical protein
MEFVKKWHNKFGDLLKGYGVNPWMLFMAEGALIVLLLQWFF